MATHAHTTVLRDEVVHALVAEEFRHYADVTCGLGGHTEALLSGAHAESRFLVMDRDPEALAYAKTRLASAADRCTFVEASFSELEARADHAGLRPLDAVVADLGVSSVQLDRPERGFSFRSAGPLDMRMGPTVAEDVGSFLDRVDEAELARVLRTYGEVKRARTVARRILSTRDGGGLVTTLDLARVVESVVGRKPGGIHPATLVFQALRIAVNRELEELSDLLDALERVVRPGGRVAIISFHSLEDRMVKQRFAGPRTDPELRHLPVERPVGPWRARGGIVTPSETEVVTNPRSRSAKLRVAERREDA
jgi:16S rRNA (cytosine1402-N4)-methyltransferase